MHESGKCERSDHQISIFSYSSIKFCSSCQCGLHFRTTLTLYGGELECTVDMYIQYVQYCNYGSINFNVLCYLEWTLLLVNKKGFQMNLITPEWYLSLNKIKCPPNALTGNVKYICRVLAAFKWYWKLGRINSEILELFFLFRETGNTGWSTTTRCDLLCDQSSFQYWKSVNLLVMHLK